MPQMNIDIAAGINWLQRYIFGGDTAVKSLTLSQVRILYKLAEYYSIFTIVGTAEEKMAQYPVSNIIIPLKDKEKKTVERIIRKIKLKEKLTKAGIYRRRYGVAFIYPMYPTKKYLKCRNCGAKTALDALYYNGKKLYEFKDFKFYFSCTNKDCEKHGIKTEFDVHDQEIKDIERLNIAVWKPHHLEAIDNEILDTKTWQYKIPPTITKYIREGEHHILCTTPQIFIDASRHESARITLNKDRLFVMEMQTDTVGGMPIPPIVRALRSLKLDEAYDNANKTIAEDMLVPLRMLFPVERGAGRVPQQITINQQDFTKRARSEIDKWRDNKGKYIPIMPIELGSKDYWGTGKLLVLHDHLRANTQDILAKQGIPLEFIYGGVTWSRQNVSALVLENQFQVACEIMQELLDWLAETIKSAKNLEECIIRIIPPRLVESMAELEYLRYGKERLEVSNETFYDRFHMDYNNELRKVEEEKKSYKDIAELRGEIEGSVQVSAERTVRNFQRVIRDEERREQLKDGLTMSVLEAQSLERQIKAQKEIMDHHADMSLDQMNQSMDMQLQMMREQMKIQLEGMKEEVLSQKEIEKIMAEMEEQEQNERHLELGLQQMTPEMEKDMQGLSEEEQQQYIIQMGQEAEIMQFAEMLPPQIKDWLATLDSEERSTEVMRLFQEYNKMEMLYQSDPKQLGDIIRQEREDELNHIRMMKLTELYKDSPANVVWQKLEEKDPELAAEVKSRASKEIIDYYSDKLIAAKKEEENKILEEAKLRYPALVPQIEDEAKNKVTMRLSAMEYAKYLFQMREDQERLNQFLGRISEEAPEDFREMIMEYLEQFMNAEKERIADKSKLLAHKEIFEKKYRDIAKNMAMSLIGMPEEERKPHLDAIRYEHPELFRIINDVINQRMMEE